MALLLFFTLEVSITVPSYSMPHATSYVLPNELEHFVEASGVAQMEDVSVGQGGELSDSP